MEYGAFNKLMSIYTNLTQQTETRTKALHAISALIKGNTTCELTFLHQKGLATLRLDMKLKVGPNCQPAATHMKQPTGSKSMILGEAIQLRSIRLEAGWLAHTRTHTHDTYVIHSSTGARSGRLRACVCMCAHTHIHA